MTSCRICSEVRDQGHSPQSAWYTRCTNAQYPAPALSSPFLTSLPVAGQELVCTLRAGGVHSEDDCRDRQDKEHQVVKL